MGLLFPFPVDENEDHVSINSSELIVKSYGLPYLFWYYAGAILVLLFTMFLVIKNPLYTFWNTNFFWDKVIVVLVWLLFITLPMTLLSFLFYQKILVKKDRSLTVIHKIFFLPVRTSKLVLSGDFFVSHFMDSPNMAARKKNPLLSSFYNKGHFHLWAVTDSGNKLIDRHSQKRELERLRELLGRF